MNTHTRTLSIPHLVFGLVFLGVAAVWAIGEATDADLGHTAVGFPAVLILAGVIGLVAAVAGSRPRRPDPAAPVESSESEVDA
jgi:heme A synthase